MARLLALPLIIDLDDPAARQVVELVVDKLIDELDERDAPHEYLEPDESGIGDAGGIDSDTEDDDPPEDNGDREPWLGAAEHHPHGHATIGGSFNDHQYGWQYGTERTARGSQERWATTGSRDDREDEHDGSEDGHDAEDDRADAEYSLGWTTSSIKQSGQSWLGDTAASDREHDTSDYEPDTDAEPDADGEPDTDAEPEETDHSYGERRSPPPQEAKHEPFVLTGPDGNLWKFKPVPPMASKPEGGR